jgi:hypothetical protein
MSNATSCPGGRWCERVDALFGVGGIHVNSVSLLYMSCISFNSAMGSLIGKGKPGAIRGRKATGPTRSAGLPTSKGSVMHAQDWIISSFDVGCGPSLCRTLGYAEKGHTLPG